MLKSLQFPLVSDYNLTLDLEVQRNTSLGHVWDYMKYRFISRLLLIEFLLLQLHTLHLLQALPFSLHPNKFSLATALEVRVFGLENGSYQAVVCGVCQDCLNILILF